MTFIWSNSSCFLFTFLFPVGAAVSKAWGYFIHFCEFKSLIPLSLSVWLQKIRHLFLERNNQVESNYPGIIPDVYRVWHSDLKSPVTFAGRD